MYNFKIIIKQKVQEMRSMKVCFIHRPLNGFNFSYITTRRYEIETNRWITQTIITL